MTEEVMALFRELADLSPAARQEYYASRHILPNIRDEVESLLQFDTPSGSFTTDIAQTASELLQTNGDIPEGTRWGPYRILRLLGWGGMGAVYLADRADGEVEQRVAIKVAHSRADLPGFHERFLRERRILAVLNHPGVARLFDAGHTTSGQPYLVMEYVDGVPIDTYCSKLDPRSILRLFLSVCDAVSYAHRSLIIHRDLKPSNILVDSTGHPKLLDFGIARILGDTDPSRTVTHILTPEYASPEQMRGEAHTTATDIYSLGAVLYRLLVGEAPLTTTASSPKPLRLPGRMRPEIPRDIDFIVEKALRAEPDERYATADAFADDIRAFLESRPVRARAGSGWYFTRKFLRRHWVPVTAGAVALIGLSAGLYVANTQRAIAERRFLEVRQLATKIFDIDAAIRNTPGTAKARQMIVATSLAYLQKVGAETHGDKDLALEIGSAYLQLAHVQGVPVNSNLGQFEQADQSLGKADEFIDSVLKSAPGNRRALLLASTIAHDRMVLAGVQGRRDQSVSAAVNAAGKLDRFTALGNLDANEVKEVAFMYSNVAVTFDENHRYQDAIRHARRSIEVAKLIQASGPQQSLAYGILADALRAVGDLDGALAAVRESRRLQEQFTNPGQTWQRANLVLALWREGSILGEDGDINLDRPQDAITVLRRAAAIADELAMKDPDDATHHQLAGEVQRRVGDILRRSDPRAALAAYDQGIRRLVEIRNANVSTRRTQAALLASSSYALRSLHRARDAKQRIDAAFQLLEKTKDYPSARIEPASEADLALRALGDHYTAAGDPTKAADTYQDLLSRLQTSKPEPDNDLRTAVYLSGIYSALAQNLRAAGLVRDATSYEAQLRRLWQHWDQKLPNNGFVHRQLTSAFPN